MNLLSARPRTLRWLVPLAVVAVVGGGVALASASRSDSATPSLPPRTAEALLADVSQARVPGLSGTVVETARLGLPELPSLGGRGRASLTGLVSGSHTVRVWLRGEDRARLAVTGSLAESDVIRDRQDLWIYSSESNAVTHYDLTGAGRAEAPQRPPGTADGLAPAPPPGHCAPPAPRCSGGGAGRLPAPAPPKGPAVADRLGGAHRRRPDQGPAARAGARQGQVRPGLRGRFHPGPVPRARGRGVRLHPAARRQGDRQAPGERRRP